MTNSASSNEEIDLFELIQVLWDGKYVILGVALICGVLAAGYAMTKKPNFTSNMVYSIDTIPPFYEEQKPLNDFRSLFYTKQTFDSWRAQSGVSQITFDDFSDSKIVDGVTLKRSAKEQLAVIAPESKGAHKIIITSGDLVILNEFYEYARYITQLLNQEYVSRARDELGIYEARFADLKASNQSVIENVLSIDRYTVAAEKGADVLKIERPTMPLDNSRRKAIIVILAMIMGGIVSSIYVLVRNAWRQRQVKMAHDA